MINQIRQKILEWVLRRLKIPSLASRMFKISNKISGLNSDTLPKELIPLNSIQLSRGLLNYAFIQSRIIPEGKGSNWVYPFWISKQYNPADASFLPRSHSGLSLNLTQRNWTAVGNPECIIEPIVDPRGLLTPFPNGWSIDAWLMINDKIFFPSRSSSCIQKLIDDLPIVETVFVFEGIQFKLVSFTEREFLFHKISLENESEIENNFALIISIRPFNPEGACPINSIYFDTDNDRFTINNDEYLLFNKKPDLIHCSDFKNGDAAELLFDNRNGKNNFSSDCEYGFASAFSLFNISLKPGEIYSVQCSVPLNKSLEIPFRQEISHLSAIQNWNRYLDSSAEIFTPDEKINSLIRSSVSALLMLTDKKSITPGPFTYHQFWFRDAAFMLFALDKFGLGNYTVHLVKSFPEHQEPSGYFRSQKGEWDSNGQVLWMVYNHYLINREKCLLEDLFESLYTGVKWIEKFRLTKKEFADQPFYGLLPKGISAEHLGHADYYFWDNFWSLAGIKSFIKICDELGKVKEKVYAEDLFFRYKEDIEKALRYVSQKYSIKEIPASPLRNIDCGMIGSVCAAYPLQLFPPNDEKIISTLDTLHSKFFYDGLFFQQFIHSGMNPYLTLQVAHSYLFSGNRKKFWEIFSAVVSKASSTLNYPEAIHPLTGGGVMGDGHHGWVSAEILSAARDAFIFENEELNEGVLLQGIPVEWFSDNKFSLNNSQISLGIISIHVECCEDEISLNIDFNEKTEIKPGYKWKINLPVQISEAKEGTENIPVIPHDDYSEIIVAPKSSLLSLKRMKKVKSAVT